MSRFSDLNALMQGFVDRGLPGCACTIAQKGEILYEGYFGKADIKNGKPVTAASLFRQASMTKLTTYAVSMMLFEEGKYLLNEPLYEYLPEWRHTNKFVTLPNGQTEIRPLENPITIRDALAMACGLPYCFGPGQSDNPTLQAMNVAMKPLFDRGYWTNREAIQAVSAAPVMFEPGTHWQYGFGSEIISGLVEVVTGKPLPQVLRERIFEPLGMKDTDTHFRDDLETRLVRNYRCAPDGALTEMPPEADRVQRPGPENTQGTPRLMSTTNDFTKFMQMWANGGKHEGKRIMGRQTIDLMRTNHLNEAQMKDFTNSYLAGYGYGLGVRMLIDKAAGQHNGSLGAFGWTGGAGTWAESDPATGVSIVYMHNMMPNKEEYHHLRVRSVAYGCIE